MRVWPASPRHPKTLAKSSLIFNRSIGGLGATLRLHFELILGSKNRSDFISIFTSKNDAKMAPKWEGGNLGKFGLGLLGGSRVTQGRPGRPRELKIEPQGRPDRSELDPKGHPEPSKFDL